MLNALLPFFNRTPKSSPIRMNRWDGYLQRLRSNTDNLVDRNRRYTDDPIPSNGIDFINSLITRADIPYLMRTTNDVDLLRQIYREYNSPVYSDMIRQHPLKDQFFIAATGFNPPEFLLITEDFDIEDELPLGDDDIEVWMNTVKPLRMLDVDSLEVRLNVTTSRLRYRFLPPTNAIFSINIVKLLMLYIKYRQAYPDDFKDGVHNFPFIFRTCILPMLHDNIRSYAFRVINDMIVGRSGNPDYKFNERNILHGTLSNFLIGQRTPAVREVEDMINRCADHKTKPDEIILALKVSPDLNLIDFSSWIMDRHYISHGGRQFEWLTWLRDQQLLTSLIHLYSLQPDTVRTQELYKLFRIMSRRLIRTRFWSHARPRFLAAQIEEDFINLVTLVG